VKISAFCGTFPAKLCTAEPANSVACILSPRFFSRPLDYGNMVRIFYVIEIARFIACSQPVLFELLLGEREDLSANWCINLPCISCH
jgi:hypothetical protein